MSLSSFKSSIYASSRGLWSGQLDSLSFADSIFSNLRRGYTQAFQEGAKQCGVLPDEITEVETEVLNGMIGDANQYVGGLADYISTHSKALGFSFEEIKPRLSLWVNRYEEVKAKAQGMACGDKKLKWLIDGGEHCRTCLKLNGRVHRASVWNSHNIAPRMITDKLHCHGYNCKCRFEETKEPATRGRFPNLP
jgi:hypothetical protein